jgi:hypothetical protein
MTASTEILTAIAAWAPKPAPAVEAQAALAAIFEGEGGRSFRELFSGGTLLTPGNPSIESLGSRRLWTGSLAAFPDWGGAKLANGTITHAAGAGQDEPATDAEVSRLTGIAGFEPIDQLDKNWFLAQHDFTARGGQDLLAALMAGHPELVTTYLIKVWPGGADSGFVKRYAANLAALKALSVPPPLPPPPYAGMAPLKLSLALLLKPSSDGHSLELTAEQLTAGPTGS